ncbi:uncharacterized protein LY79DRAFT_567865 [Colletotrichum navitas]|uniref:Uncharacterized protein n=1 Tax=Colletotrichum navitas TaxID=681940 RepID=A0AAD8V001_9PEZI|nr:uncharacterized protein LY79DRAFT_567865 [Colletotrichum navitas]KAK1573763.1 hypothetical protein LY79DRAFT_567865 [Colletotrichum navitas]
MCRDGSYSHLTSVIAEERLPPLPARSRSQKHVHRVFDDSRSILLTFFFSVHHEPVCGVAATSSMTHVCPRWRRTRVCRSPPIDSCLRTRRQQPETDFSSTKEMSVTIGMMDLLDFEVSEITLMAKLRPGLTGSAATVNEERLHVTWCRSPMRSNSMTDRHF